MNKPVNIKDVTIAVIIAFCLILPLLMSLDARIDAQEKVIFKLAGLASINTDNISRIVGILEKQ